MRTSLLVFVAVLSIATSAASPAVASPAFILKDIGGVGVGTQARAGFTAAAALWSSVFSNNVTIQLNVGFQSLGAGVLGETGSSSNDVAYSDFRSALAANATSVADASAVASLAPTLSFESNTLTGGNTNIKTRLLENNQSNLDTHYLNVNTADQKAIGLLPSNGNIVDGSITFSSAFKWTYDISQGLNKGTYDFVGIAAHEIGHALGFISGVDTADSFSYYHSTGLEQTAWGTPLDLFRYNRQGMRDWTLGGVPCFSIDSGESCGARFATGAYAGDHYQASHWKHGYHLGIMDPTVAAGQALSIGPNDLQAFDVIGWNLAPGGISTPRVTWGTPTTTPNPESSGNIVVPNPVPEAGTFGLLGSCLAAAWAARWRKRTA